MTALGGRRCLLLRLRLCRGGLVRRISDSACNSAAKMYCAGRWFEIDLQSIGPVVLTPKNATHIAFNGLTRAALAAVGS